MFTQSNSTHIHKDNGAIAVLNNENSTKRLRYDNLHYLAILDWVQNGDMILKKISTTINPDDEFAKLLGTYLHHRCSDTSLGKRTPSRVFL